VKLAVAQLLPREPDLVVWPESAVPGYLRYDDRARGFVTGLSRTIETPIFTGTNDADTLAGASGEGPADYRVFNAAYLVSGDSIFPGRYAKRRLVPIAERVPFLVEIGVLLDLFVGVFIMGIVVFHINREFDSLSSARLTELKD
jgi:apolipoprotein N-acyltransferase